MSRICTFILARAGSRRIPQKNVAPFRGRPLIMWTVDTAISMGFPVYVFTDMPEIKKLLIDYNVTIKDKLFENESGIHETGKELQAYNANVKADHIILLQPTSPMRDILKIIGWIEEYLDGDYDSGVAAKKMQQGFFYRDNVALYNRTIRDYNSKNIEVISRETGSFFIFKKAQIEKNHFLDTEKLIVFEDKYSIDIDSPEDLQRWG